MDSSWKMETGKTQSNMEDSREENPRGQSELGGGGGGGYGGLGCRSWQKTGSSGKLWLQPNGLLSMKGGLGIKGVLDMERGLGMKGELGMERGLGMKRGLDMKGEFRGTDFPFQIFPFSVSECNKFCFFTVSIFNFVFH